jgi:hypothetical protein
MPLTTIHVLTCPCEVTMRLFETAKELTVRAVSALAVAAGGRPVRREGLSGEQLAVVMLGALQELPRGGRRRAGEGAGREGVPVGALISLRAAATRFPRLAARFGGAYGAVVDAFWELMRAWDRMDGV